MKMGQTMIEKILSNHASGPVKAGDIADITIDVRVARDFGGANVVKNLEDNGLPVHDVKKTFFTFDCNPGGSNQKYAKNQHICRRFARKEGIKVYDIDSGIGTHVAIEKGLIYPGGTLVSTDSHANIMGAIGAFGQGMGDADIAHAFAFGRVWFKVPPSLKIILKGTPSGVATPKDVVLACLQKLGANGLLGYSAEFYGEYLDDLDLPGRITMASMATEMGGIIALFPPNDIINNYYKDLGVNFEPVLADPDAVYDKEIEVNIQDLRPMISRPGHPEDVVPVDEVKGTKIDSGFIGSCTNGRIEDLEMAANLLKGRKVAPGVVLKLVPATDSVWRKALEIGLVQTFKDAGVLIGNAGCAGCAAGQIGQTGEQEVTVSSGNRNFAGKQGLGNVWLASPATVAASAIAGYITTADQIPGEPTLFKTGTGRELKAAGTETGRDAPLKVSGRAWVIKKDNIDTDMIFHNQHLHITDINEMGQHAFGNLEGHRDFSQEAKPGDIIVTGKNFGAGSSRAQAVDCFKALGISVIIAESFGAIYERNAINSAMPIMVLDEAPSKINDGDTISVDFQSGEVKNETTGQTLNARPFSEVQINIYRKGGLLRRE